MKIGILEHLLHVCEDRLFAVAREVGLDGVALSCGAYDGEQWTILKPGGPERLRAQAADAGVELPALSAGYFCRVGLLPEASEKPVELLGRLVQACAQAGIPLLHLPLYGASDVRTPGDRRRCAQVLAPLVEQAAAQRVSLALESLLPAEELKQFVQQFRSRAVGVCYDVGNARAAGRDVAAEITLLGPVLSLVHIKDRRRREPFAGVPLGEGAVHWPDVPRTLREAGYVGWLVLDTPSGGDALASARRNREFLESLLGREVPTRPGEAA